MSKILRINLSNKEISQEDISAEDELNFIGGTGISTAIFT